MYKEQRNYENVQKMMFQEIGNYGVAQIEPTHFESADFIGFNYAKHAKNTESTRQRTS